MTGPEGRRELPVPVRPEERPEEHPEEHPKFPAARLTGHLCHQARLKHLDIPVRPAAEKILSVPSWE